MRGPLLAVLWLGLSAVAVAAQEPGPPPRPIPPSPDGVVPAITGPDRLDPYTLGLYVLPFDGGELDEVAGLDVVVRGKEAIVTGRPGKYLLVVRWGEIVGTKVMLRSARKAVTIGDPPPPPPPPPPPGPRDPLVDELKPVYAADPSPTKGADLAVLGEVYKLMAGESLKPEYRTADDVGKKYKAAVTQAVNGRLIPLRTRCSREVDAASPDADAPLTDDGRKKLAAAFARLATVLPQVTQ